MNLKIEKDFEGLLGPMSPEAFEQLKANLKENPDSFPRIYVWGNHKAGNIILDGHHQYKARIALGLPVKPKKVNFETRQEAMDFAVKCQIGRRNLSVAALARLASKLRINAQLPTDEAAKAVGISKRTVEQFEAIQNDGSEPLKKAVAANEVSVSDGAAILDKPKAEQTKLVKEKQKGERRAVGGPSFDTEQIERQPTRNGAPRKSGKPIISKNNRIDAQKHLGGLIRALKKLDIYDEFIESLSAIAARLKKV